MTRVTSAARIYFVGHTRMYTRAWCAQLARLSQALWLALAQPTASPRARARAGRGGEHEWTPPL